jgi:hypothetical protein
MPILQIEHPVRDFDSWRAAFESDPVGREQGGVRHYWILRPAGEPDYVVVDLELDTVEQAEAFLEKLRRLWERAVEQGLIESPRARILEMLESVPVGGDGA